MAPIQSRVAGELLPAIQRGQLSETMADMERDRAEEAAKKQRVAALEAVESATQTERANIPMEFLGSASRDVAMAMGSNPDAFTNVRRNNQAFVEAGLTPELAAQLGEFLARDPEGFQALLGALQPGISGQTDEWLNLAEPRT